VIEIPGFEHQDPTQLLFGLGIRAIAAEELLAELGLAKRAHALPAQLSGGQQ